MTTNKSGQILIEISIGVGLFVMIAAALITLTLGSYQSNFQAAQETKASHLAGEGIEAARAIKNYNWENLTNGSHGLTYANGFWEFQGSLENIGPYAREIIIESLSRQNNFCGLLPGQDVIDPDIKKVISKITWKSVSSKPRITELVSYLSNWTNPVKTRCSKCELYEISSVVEFGADTVLDWSGKDVVIKPGGHLKADSKNNPISLTITTNCSLIIEDGGKITAEGALSNGNGGVINITASEVKIVGTISANGYSLEPIGLSANGGSINIEATDLNIPVTGKMRAWGYTFSPSTNSLGGIATVKTTNFNHQGEISVDALNVQSASEKPDAGTINIECQELVNSGKINANTYGRHGRAGIIKIKTANASSNNTNITVDSWGITGVAVGGKISLSANRLNILNSSVSAIDIKNNKKPGIITLIYCGKDFTGATFNPTPIEIVSCP
ncbi:MAG: hypothetical protein AAB465_00515 [Patescibacteria group bacterium]